MKIRKKSDFGVSLAKVAGGHSGSSASLGAFMQDHHHHIAKDIEDSQLLDSNSNINSNYESIEFSKMKKNDPLIRDRKKVPMAGMGEAIPAFLASLFLMGPIWLTVLIPVTIAWQGFSFVKNAVIGNGPKKTTAPEDPKELISMLKKIDSKKPRKHDLVMFGATGFTGRLACLYLAKQYGSKVRWAIAGRRRDALEKIRDEVAKIDSSLKDLPIIIADSFDEAALNNMTQSTKVVITTAGPFSKYGTPLVKSCVLHGTHYCDITGETDWVREMIDQFDGVARVSGAHIVHFCGHDCVPWDLSVLKAAKFLKQKGETLSSVNILHFFSSFYFLSLILFIFSNFLILHTSITDSFL
jgi:hypothetical protein